MPFDGHNGERFGRLRALSAALRDPKCWPPQFRWSYGSCWSCAIGLAEQLSIATKVRKVNRDHITADLVSVFDISPDDAAHIFLDLSENYVLVTPEDVADAIDELLVEEVEHAV